MNDKQFLYEKEKKRLGFKQFLEKNIDWCIDEIEEHKRLIQDHKTSIEWYETQIQKREDAIDKIDEMKNELEYQLIDVVEECRKLSDQIELTEMENDLSRATISS